MSDLTKSYQENFPEFLFEVILITLLFFNKIICHLYFHALSTRGATGGGLAASEGLPCDVEFRRDAAVWGTRASDGRLAALMFALLVPTFIRFFWPDARKARLRTIVLSVVAAIP
jgi:hypothetical protein